MAVAHLAGAPDTSKVLGQAVVLRVARDFVALPGGIGTFEELFEVWTWSQLGYHSKPCALLNVKGYYDAMRQFIDHVVDEGFLQTKHRDMLMIHDDPEALLDAIVAYLPQPEPQWIEREDT